MGLSCIKGKTPTIQGDPIEALQELKSSLEVRIGSTHYSMQQHKLTAQKFKREGDMIRSNAEMIHYKQKEATYKKYVSVHTQITTVLHKIDETQVGIDMAQGFGMANDVLKGLLERVDMSSIEGVLDGIRDQLEQVDIIQSELSMPLDKSTVDVDETDFDVPLVIPSVPVGTTDSLPVNIPEKIPA